MANYIFDFDGVLANTLEHYVTFISQVTKWNHEKTLKFVMKRTFKNNKISLIESLVEKTWLPSFASHLAKQKDILFLDRLEELKNIPGRKAVLTRNYSELCREVLGQYVTEFDVIMGTDICKTKTKGFKLLFDEFNFEKKETYFITDTVGDIVEAQKVLPINQIYAVSWGFNSRNDLEKIISSERIIDSFSAFVPEI